MLVFAAGFTLLVAYIVYVLLTSSGSDLGSNSFDAFVDVSKSLENLSKNSLVASFSTSLNSDMNAYDADVISWNKSEGF